MNYYYSQKDPRWSSKQLGKSGLDMKNFGCVITACSIFLSYHLEKEITPDKLIDWLNEHDGFTNDGRLYWEKIVEYAKDQHNVRIRFSYSDKLQDKNELTYGLHQAYFGRYNHWVVDHPREAAMIIDPIDGKEKQYSSYKYTGQNRFYLGMSVKKYPVDNRYGLVRTWKGFLREQTFVYHWIPGTAANYIYRKIGRVPTAREVMGLAYGFWDYAAIFENRVGDTWLYKIKDY